MAIDKLGITVDEIRTTIKQTFDDKDVSRAQVAYWVMTVANKLLGQHGLKRESGAFLSVFIVPVITAVQTLLPNIIKGRKYIELPKNIFDWDRDDGIEYMAYYDPDENCEPDYQKKTMTRVSPIEIQWLKANKHTEPSPANSYFWRTGEQIHLVGIERVPVNEIEIGLYVTIDPLTKMDLEAPFMFPGELLSQLKREVTDLARYSFLFPEDQDNDGASDDPNRPIPKIASVNEQNQQ